MKKIISLRAIVVTSLALSALVLATTATLTTTAPFSAYADQDKHYISESGSVQTLASCDNQEIRETTDFNNCSQFFKGTRGQPLNPALRERCENFSGEECHQVK